MLLWGLDELDELEQINQHLELADVIEVIVLFVLLEKFEVRLELPLLYVHYDEVVDDEGRK